MSDWADVAAWAHRQLEPVRQHERFVSAYASEKRERAARRNVERWFRELPADMVHAYAVADGCRPGCVLAGDEALVAGDWLLARGLGLKTPRPMRPPTPREWLIIRALKACRFPPATASKRFVRDLNEASVTDGQMGWARQLVTKFRRQIPREALHSSDLHLLEKGRPA